MAARRRIRIGTLLAAGTAVAAFAVAGPAAQAAASPAATTVLTGDVLPGLSSLTPTAIDPTSFVQVGISMANPNAAAQQAAYNAIYTPGSASYHHFLTRQEVAQQFGVSSTTFGTLTSWATRDGMRAVYAPDTNEYLLLQGTASQAEQTFSVTLGQYTWNGKSFYANSTAPTVPAGLGVAGVIGLNNLLGAHTTNHARPAAAAPASLAQTGCTGPACTGLTTPQDLWSIYGQATNMADPTQDFGQGQQMAVLGEGNVTGPLNDLRAFESEFHLPQVKVTIAAIGDSFTDTSGNGEWDIDSQASTGMSPKAYGETWIFANDLTDASVEADFSGFQQANGVMEANASFGECEQDPTSSVTGSYPGTSGFGGLAGTAGVMFTQQAENTLQQATLEGKTLFSSTGDTGSSCPVVAAAVIGAGNGILNQGNPETNYPASSVYVVAVGGTVLFGTPSTATAPASNATRYDEYSWNYGGGGTTFYIPEPAYQKGITPTDTEPCLSQPNGTPYATNPTPCRGIPDVAAQSGDVATSNGYAVNMGGVPDSQGAGTSLSSPLWMGMWARVQAATTNQVGGHFTNGFANPALYKVGENATQDVNDFFDIGNNSATAPLSQTESNGYYTNLPRNTLDASGWDYISGLGSPNVCNLTKDITGNTCSQPTDNVAQAAVEDCGQPGLTPCTAGVTCTPTGVLWSNPSHTSSDLLGNSDPQLSLLNGNFVLSGSTLKVLLTVNNLAETVPQGAAADEWYMLWSYGGTTYFANAELTSVAAAAATGPTFNDGTVTQTGTTHSYNNAHTDTGTFTTGANGVVEIDVPLANVGTPATGAQLTGPSGETDIEVGVPGGGGFLEKVDTGGPVCDYTVGTGPTSPPVANVPEAPLGVMIPALGLAIVAVTLWRRKRRSGVDVS